MGAVVTMNSRTKRTPHFLEGIKEGALTRQVKQKYGARGFTPRGTIKVAVLEDLTKSRNETTRKRAQLALNMRKFRR